MHDSGRWVACSLALAISSGSRFRLWLCFPEAGAIPALLSALGSVRHRRSSVTSTCS